MGWKIAICDDDAGQAARLQADVTDWAHGACAVTCFPSAEAFRFVGDTDWDILLLDVEMPGRSGIHVGTRLKEFNPKIKVFIVTSFSDYLDEAMRFQVFRYLSKPIDKSRLFRNLKDAVYLHNMETHVIPVTSKDGVVALPADQFVCVETDSR